MPETQGARRCSGCKPGPQQHCPPRPRLGHPLRPGLGGTCCSWPNPKPFGEVYFYQSRSRSWNPPRASPSPHAARGARGAVVSRPSPPRPPRKPSWSPHPPLHPAGRTEGPPPTRRPRTATPSIPVLPPIPSAAECPSPGEGMSQRRDPEPVNPTLPPAQGLAPGGLPTCLWKEQVTERSGQRSRSGKCPEPITGSQPLRSRGNSKVTYATQAPSSRTPPVTGASYSLAAPLCLRRSLSNRFGPPVPAERPLLGWGPAGGKLPSRLGQRGGHGRGQRRGSGDRAAFLEQLASGEPSSLLLPGTSSGPDRLP